MRKVRQAVLAGLVLATAGQAQASGSFGEFQAFSTEFQSLPLALQMDLRNEPSNFDVYPTFQFPQPPALRIKVMAGADWRLNDGYGMWLGDGESPLATAADFSAYDKAQNVYFLYNRNNFARFNKQFRKAAKAYAKQYAETVSQIVAQNDAYQTLLLAYPQAVTKDYVMQYLRQRDYNLEDLQHTWIVSVSKIKRDLGYTLGSDLANLDINYVKSGLDHYVRNINKELIYRERDIINSGWTPLEANALAPLEQFKPRELTVAEAEKIKWGLPPVRKVTPPPVGANSPFEVGPEQQLQQAFQSAVQGGRTTSEQPWLQWLALLLLAAVGVFWFWRKSKRSRSARTGTEKS